MTRKFKDLTGKIFGRLTVLKLDHRDEKGNLRYLCHCECGKEKTIMSSSLSKGLTISCGCYRIEQVSKSGKLRRTNGVLMSAKQMWKNSYTDGCSFETFIKLSQEPCFYCGSPPSNKFNQYINSSGKIKQKISEEWADQSWFLYNGLDRIDSTLPHIETNIVPCCKICNYAKRSLSLNEFRRWVHRLTQTLVTRKW